MASHDKIETSQGVGQNIPMKKLISLCITILFATQVQAGLLFNYSQLALKDLDQMNKLVRGKVAEAKRSGGDQSIPLKEALQAVFSRPNDDFMSEKILPTLKAELEERDAWESSLQALVKEAIGALKNPRAFKPVVQVTYLVFLENLMAEMKPQLAEDFERKMFQQIRDSKIEISKEAANERRLRVMKETLSPSQLADKFLKDFEENQKRQKSAPAAEKPSAPSN